MEYKVMSHVGGKATARDFRSEVIRFKEIFFEFAKLSALSTSIVLQCSR